MKKSILLTAVLLTSYFAFSQEAISTDWKLSAKEARAMMQYYTDCKGDCFASKARPDTVKENLIRAAYPNARSFGWVNARYRSDNQTRYASRNELRLKSGGEQITGYTTQLFKVVDQDGSAYFFDIVTICPPPSVCDSQDE